VHIIYKNKEKKMSQDRALQNWNINHDKKVRKSTIYRYKLSPTVKFRGTPCMNHNVYGHEEKYWITHKEWNCEDDLKISNINLRYIALI